VRRLEQMARKLGMDFLSHVHPPVVPVPPHSQSPALTPATQASYGERNTDHWGLNE